MQENPKVFPNEWDSLIKQEIFKVFNLVNGELEFLLDIGCGEGKWDLVVSATSIKTEIVSIDVLKDSMIKNQRSNCSPKIHYILADGAHVPLRENVVGAVLIINVFHHLSSHLQLQNLFGEVKRVAEANSPILSVENTTNNPFKNLLTRFWENNISKNEHARLSSLDALPSFGFTQSQLFHSFHNKGFVVIEINRENLFFIYFFTVLGILKFNLRSKRIFFALRKLEQHLLKRGLKRYCSTIHIIAKTPKQT